jgi:hypothetical protein
MTPTSSTTTRADWKRRLFAAWIVASLAWLAGWVVYISKSCIAEAPADPQWCYTNLFSGSMSNRFTIWDYASIALSGAAIPVAVLFVGVVTWWARNGLRRDN